MGYLESSNTIIKNTSDALDNILSSKASIYLSGLGDPVLVNWWNMNDSISTVDNGTGSVDALLGKESPLRYNKIIGLPAYNITKDLQNIEMSPDDNGVMDMNIELEVVLLPNTIIPGPYDYMEYVFASGRNVFFRVNNVQINSLKTNGYYKVPMHLVDIDSKDYPNGIDEITVKTMKVKLDNVGSNEKCIISDKVFDDITLLEKLISSTLSDYIDAFFVRRYNCFILRGFKDNYTIYDPYLTNFIFKNTLLNNYDEILQPMLLEQDEYFRTEYNKSFYRAIENRDINKIGRTLYELASFGKKYANPFEYWGEEFVYCIRLDWDDEIKFPKNKYLDFNIIENMRTIKESNSVTMMENIIIRYFKKPDFDKFMNLNELNELKKKLEIEYNEYYFYMVPIVLYILIEYKTYLTNSII